MMLAYQPVKSLATVNIAFGQGLSALNELYQSLIKKIKYQKTKVAIIKIDNASIKIKDLSFKYNSNAKNIVLKK